MKMKNFGKITAGTLLIAGICSTAFGAPIEGEGSVDIDLNVNAKIKRMKITVEEKQAMDFGEFTLAATAGTYKIDASAATSSDASGSATVTGGGVASGAEKFAHFDVTADNAAAEKPFTMSLPDDIVLTATYGAGEGTTEMTLSSFTFSENPNDLKMGAAGASPATTTTAKSVYVGGTLTFAADQATGTYSGKTTVTFAYK